MAAEYTQRKKDKESGAAEIATKLITSLDVTPLLQAADDDATAYSDLQRTWKDNNMSSEEKATIEARALSIPTDFEPPSTDSKFYLPERTLVGKFCVFINAIAIYY